MKKIRITQIKSGIDRPERQKLTLRALGLNKMNATREVEATAQILGMVRAVNHLIKIEETADGDTNGSVTATDSTSHINKVEASANVNQVLPEMLTTERSDAPAEDPSTKAGVEEPSSEVFPEDPATITPVEEPGDKISPEEPIK